MKYSYLLLLFTLATWVCRAQPSSSIDNSRLIDFYQTQRYADALNYLKSVYPEPVTDVQALSQLAYSSRMSNHLNDADAYYQRIYNSDSTNMGALYNLASINVRRGNVIKARFYFQQITAKDTTNFLAYKQLAKLSMGENDIPKYIIYLQKANKLDPGEPDVASDLSNIYVNLNLLPQAEKVLGAAIAVDSSDISILQSYIKLTYAQKKWKETLKTCSQLVQLGDRSNKTLTRMGEAYYQLKNYACGAETLVSMSEELQTETSYYFTAMCYKKLNDKAMAIKYLLKTIDESISPSITTYYGELAGAYQTQKKYPKSVAAYQRGLSFSADPLLYYSLASLYDEMKDKGNAIRNYKKYLNTKPDAKQLTYVNFTKSRLAQLRN
jgi:tetratricopeptide (TPR) repeat protein